MPGVIGMLVSRIKSGLNLKVFKLIVGSIISSCMIFGMIPAYAAFAQNTLGGGAALTKPSASSTGSDSVAKPEDPNNLFANNPKLKRDLYNSLSYSQNDGFTLPDSVEKWHPTKTDMEKIKKLGLSIEDISDISFLKYFPNLEELKLDHNNISDLKPLSTLTNLKTLDLSDNNISDISKLAGLTNLKNLNLSGNNISDISKLASLTNLESLDISINKVSNVDSLVSLCNGKLISIKAEENSIRNVDKIYAIAAVKSDKLFADAKKDPYSYVLYSKSKYDSLYDFSNQHIEENITTQQAKDGYEYTKLLASTIKDKDYNFTYKYVYRYVPTPFMRPTYINDKTITINENDGVKLINFDLNKTLGFEFYSHTGGGNVHVGPNFLFNGELLIRQHKIQDFNIELGFGEGRGIDISSLKSKVVIDGFKKGTDYFDFSYWDAWNENINTDGAISRNAYLPGEYNFAAALKYTQGEAKDNKIIGYDSVDNFNIHVKVKTMAETWPAKSSDVKINDIDSSSATQSSSKPTVKSISDDVKNQVEGLFVTGGKRKYPAIPAGLKPTACDYCDPEDDDCNKRNCGNETSAYSFYLYGPMNPERTIFKKVGDFCAYTNDDDVDVAYYYKAPTVTIGDDFKKIPDATDKDQTVNVPVTVTYLDGSQCKFYASFTVKAKPKPNPDPTPTPPTPPQPQPEPQPQPQPQPQPAPQPTPTPVPTPDSQDPSVTPTPAPIPDQPGTPSNQSHMTEPEILPKPYLKIDVTPDPNIGTTPNTGSENINTTNPYINQKPDAAKNNAAQNGVSQNNASQNGANSSNTSKSGNKANTGKTANKSSNKRHKLSNTGTDTYCVIIASFSLLVLGLLVAISARRKNVGSQESNKI